MPNINRLVDEHVVLKYECIDRLFLNGYVAKLQDPRQLAWFLTEVRGEEIPRYALLGEMTRGFVRTVEQYAAEHQIPVVEFERGVRKQDVVRPFFEAADREGVVLIGTAQEKANVFRACGRRRREVGKYSATRASAFVKHFYFYIGDAERGPSPQSTPAREEAPGRTWRCL